MTKPNEKKERIVRLWNEGYNIIQIGKLVQVTKQYVSLVLLGEGIQPRADRMAKPLEERLDERTLEVLRLFREGVLPKVISEKTGVATTSISVMVQSYLTPEERETARTRRDTQVNRILRMKAQGMRNCEIAAALAISDKNVWAVLDRKQRTVTDSE